MAFSLSFRRGSSFFRYRRSSPVAFTSVRQIQTTVKDQLTHLLSWPVAEQTESAGDQPSPEPGKQ